MNGFRILLFVLGVSLTVAGQTRRALIVGNSEYKNLGPATHAGQNARVFARTLTAAQFQVALLLNVEADALAREISKFLQELKPGDSAAFYFSGFAIQEMGENYLLPVGYAPASADGIEFQSYSVKRLVRYLETKKLATGMVILDPAPASPALDKKFPEAGLASMDLRAANLVLALANLPGRAVPPAPGRDVSRFTEAWAAAAAEPALGLDAVLRRVKQQVSIATDGDQVPAEISTLVNEFAFQPQSPASMEWDRIAASKDPVALESFRQRWPGDPKALEAGKRIETLEWERAKADLDPKSVHQFLTRFPQHPEALQWLKNQSASEKTSASAAVLSAIERYSKAYESRDIEALQSARPSLTPAERKRLQEAFRGFNSIKYSLSPLGEPVVESTGATVKCRLQVEMRSNDGGSPRPVDQSVIVKLRRQGESWTIDSIQ